MDGAAPQVILLRAGEGAEDRYVTALEAAGFRARCEPVLQFTFPRQDVLRDRLARPGAYGGLIVTSPRAVRALTDALPDATAPDWQARPAYAVGPKTAARLRACGFAPTGEEGGSAAALASIIEPSKKPLLFLCSQRRRDTLPDRLSARGIAIEELVVYETHLRTDIELPSPLAQTWLAFFSPSGIEALAQAEVPISAYRRAAIGPTTAGALEEQGWAADAVAASPTPEALAAAIRQAGGT